MATKRETKKKKAPKAKSDAPPAAYFLSVTVENIRCFGPEQTLDLSDKEGRPARWTVILGDNGVGKTTLLHSLVAVQPTLETIGDRRNLWPKGMISMAFPSESKTWPMHRKVKSAIKSISGDFSCRDNHNSSASETEAVSLSFAINEQGIATTIPAEDRHAGMFCCAYGAGRRTGSAALSKGPTDDATTNLFDEDVPLRNAEEWLLQTFEVYVP